MEARGRGSLAQHNELVEVLDEHDIAAAFFADADYDTSSVARDGQTGTAVYPGVFGKFSETGDCSRRKIVERQGLWLLLDIGHEADSTLKCRPVLRLDTGKDSFPVRLTRG